MRVKYKGERPREVAPVNHPGFDVEPGQIIEVADDLGKSLLEQTELWERPPASRKEA